VQTHMGCLQIQNGLFSQQKVATRFQYELRMEFVLLTSYRYKSVCFKNIPE